MALCTDLQSPYLNRLQSSSAVVQPRHGVNLCPPPSLPSRLSQHTSGTCLPHLAPRCRFQPPSRSGASETPPTSREEAFSQARTSISVFLEKAFRDAGPSSLKQKLLHRQARLRAELPLLNESDAERASLLCDLLCTLRVGKKGMPVSFSVFSSAGVVQCLKRESFDTKSGGGVPSHSMKDFKLLCHNIAENVSPDNSQVIVLLAPKLSDVDYIMSIAKAGERQPVILLNPDWTAEEEEADASTVSFLQTFEVVYSYVPLAIQGFFSKTEGAVLKFVKSGAPSGVRWLVFAREGESMECVGSFKKRPTAVDLENALYNAMAANSPVTKSIKFLRSLVSKQ